MDPLPMETIPENVSCISGYDGTDLGIDTQSPGSCICVSAFTVQTPGDIGHGFPTGVSEDKEGNIIIVDNEAKCVKMFDKTGAHIDSFGLGLLVSPWDTIVTSSGKIVVSDPGAGDMKVFSKKGKHLLNSEIGSHLCEPYGLCYQSITKETVVTDKGFNCLFIHNPRGVVRDVLTPDDDDNKFEFPSYVNCDENNRVYFTDTQNNTVHVYDSTKTKTITYTGSEADDAKLDTPSGVCTDMFGNILIADTGNNRIHLVGKNGDFKDFIVSWEDGLVDPQALSISKEGHLIVTEGSTGVVKVFKYLHLPIVTQADKLVLSPRSSFKSTETIK